MVPWVLVQWETRADIVHVCDKQGTVERGGGLSVFPFDRRLVWVQHILPVGEEPSRCVFVACMAPRIGLQSLNTARPHSGLFFVLRVRNGSGCTVFPIFRRLPHVYGFAHAILDPLGV